MRRHRLNKHFCPGQLVRLKVGSQRMVVIGYSENGKVRCFFRKYDPWGERGNLTEESYYPISLRPERGWWIFKW